MDAATRRKVVEYVRPLAAGLDGMAYSGDIERIASISRAIAAGRQDVNSDLLDLLSLFSGQEKWVERMGHGSRTEIFLRSQGLSAAVIRALLRGLSRLDRSPVTAEEEIVHDALRIEEMGSAAVARIAQRGYRERLTFEELAETIETAARRALKTPAAESLATARREGMLDFARRLREEHREYSQRQS